MFDTLHQLMIHTGVHPANKYQCDECGWYFAFIHALTIHGRDCHDTRHHACQWYTDYFSNLQKNCCYTSIANIALNVLVVL